MSINKMFKKVLAVVAAGAMTMGMAMPTFAADEARQPRLGLLRPTTQRSERLRSLALQQSRSRQELVSLQQMQRLLCRRYHLPILKQEQFLREVRLHFRHIQKQESMSIL